MKTVYVCDRGERGLSPIAWTDKADAEAFAVEQSPPAPWPVVTFVSLDDVCEVVRAFGGLGKMDPIVVDAIIANLREAVSDG